MNQNIYIKNMVCNRCIEAVDKIFEESKIPVLNIRLGEVLLPKPLRENEVKKLREKLSQAGFELLDDAKKKIIDQIKTTAIEFVHYNDSEQKQNFSSLLSARIHKDYSYLSKLFSETEGITIEKYLINQRTERIKELMMYDELTLSEIAYKMGYSSVAHLSAQFKKTTGFSPTHFRQMPGNKRKTLDKV
jgi:AraC-like DNA-binding protein